MKNLLFLALCLTSLSLHAQKKVAGFYKGTLYNDSAHMVQNYELALAEYRGKIMGYSYVTFISKDTFYYGIRKIKAHVAGDSLVVMDDKMISNNFPEAPAKHVSRVFTIPFNGQDSLVSINGKWKTNKTKIYYSVPGSVDAAKSNDSSGSALFAHLKELNLMPQDSYVATEKTGTAPRKPAPSSGKPAPSSEDRSAVVQTSIKTKAEKTREDKNKREVRSTSITEPAAAIILAYHQRKEHLQESIEVVSDSLTLSLYDNGVVDGDSISVYLNGSQIITGTRLTAVASKRNIFVGGMGDVKLMLVAENLGTIPPNTGLLIIRDGDKNYQVNFTADMQTNASIILRRKRN